MQRILVGLDGSPYSRVVLHTAVLLAEKTGARLILFRAVSVPTEIPAHAFASPPGTLEGVMHDEASHALGDFAKEVPAEQLGGTRVGNGSAWRAICEAAKEEKVDLIVIGSQGYSTLDRLLGTVAAKVVDHADRSVLVVRRPVDET